MWDDMAVGEAVVLDGARGETLERGVTQWVHYGSEALLRLFEDFFGSLALVVDCVDVRAVR